jgi:hypothetical protein
MCRRDANKELGRLAGSHGQRRYGGKDEVRYFVKNILLLISLALGIPDIFQRATSLGISPSLAIYLLLLFVLAGSLWATAQIARNYIRWISAVILAASVALLEGFSGASGEMMTYDAFINMVNSVAFIGEAADQHPAVMLLAGAKALLLFFAIGMKPSSPVKWPKLKTIATPIAALLLLSSLMFVRGGDGGRGLPNAWVGTGYAALYVMESILDSSGPRQPVKIALSNDAVKHDIVLIIDESVAGNYLDINNKFGVRSGLVAPKTDADVSNFGLAVSTTNCSFGANLNLRFGGTRSQYKQIIASNPSIWSYAKKAGLSTIYIDAQRDHGGLQNGMDTKEIHNIDKFIQFDAVPVVNRDMAAADTIAAALNNDKAEFILVNKVGGHFPVADKYPDNFLRYRPVLQRGKSASFVDADMRKQMQDSKENWHLYRNSYRNTLEWNVGNFFDRLFAKSKIRNAFIIYTSDHGQDLHERGNPGTTTHCNPEPNLEEGVVPLVTIANGASRQWADAAEKNHNASSQYQIFPTLLGEMGYEKSAVTRIYGEALDSAKRDPYTFNSLFNARLGRDPVWKHIQPEHVIVPPVGDY